MRNIYTLILIFIAVLYLMYFSKYEREYICSPVSDKVITVFSPASWSWKNEFYILPYKYEAFSIPDTNYIIISPKGDGVLHVNWEPEKFYLKMHMTGSLICDSLGSRILYYNAPFGYLDENESYYYPKYGSYEFHYIMKGCYNKTFKSK